MPVLGHAFVGLAIGISTTPRTPEEAWPRSASFGVALWIPFVVALAYLPDIVAQLIDLSGWSDAGRLTHSIAFALTASALIAIATRRFARLSFRRAFIITSSSIVSHDLLDLAQATDRVPWWPLSDHPISLGFTLPTDAYTEGLLFGSAFGLFLIGRQVVLRLATGRWRRRQPLDHRRPWAVWLARAATAAIMLAALLTHSLREFRERRLHLARTLIEHGEYSRVFGVLEEAERWPSTAKPGRIEYLRAEAYAALGDRSQAEYHYLTAYRADPSYFWVLADLAVFYASSDQPEAERRRIVAPYLSRLQTEFGQHPHLLHVLVRVERKLTHPPTGAATRESESSGDRPAYLSDP